MIVIFALEIRSISSDDHTFMRQSLQGVLLADYVQKVNPRSHVTWSVLRATYFNQPLICEVSFIRGLKSSLFNLSLFVRGNILS